MTSYHSEMKVPYRPAPPPPVNNSSAWAPSKNGGNEKYPARDVYSKPVSTTQKKKPPPRPPPPKLTSKQDKRQVPTRPSQLITNLFQRKSQTQTQTASKIGNSKLSKSYSELTDIRGGNNGATGCLIDFSSPPSSPTFTTRSSSDCVSVNSFGSDGVTPCSTSSGNTSNVESGFEDDFEFFGGINSKRSDNTDPWSLLSQEANARSRNPSPLACPNQTTNGKKGSWVTFSSPSASKKISNALPTIIRVKPDRPSPPVFARKQNGSHAGVFEAMNLPHANRQQPCVDEDEEEEWSSSESPPMPTGPPPAPPAEVLSSLFAKADIGYERRKPHGIALYDYHSGQPDDLFFREHDVIELVRRIDNNWLVGSHEGRQGSVPANFLRVVVPLEEEMDSNLRTALYTFHPETWDDLGFSEGESVKVTARIDADWLYGECNGKTGQFPANFIDSAPVDLPLRKSH